MRGSPAKNTQRKAKELWTENEPGLPVTLFEAYDENEEAQYVAREIKRLASSGGYRAKLDNIAAYHPHKIAAGTVTDRG